MVLRKLFPISPSCYKDPLPDRPTIYFCLPFALRTVGLKDEGREEGGRDEGEGEGREGKELLIKANSMGQFVFKLFLS